MLSQTHVFWQLFILEPLLELDKQKDFSSQYVFPSKNLDFVLNTSINSYSFKAFHNLVSFYRTRTQSLPSLVNITKWLTHWLLFSRLDWFDSGLWGWLLNTSQWGWNWGLIKIFKLKFGWNLEAKVRSWFWGWNKVNILKLSLVWDS